MTKNNRRNQKNRLKKKTSKIDTYYCLQIHMVVYMYICTTVCNYGKVNIYKHAFAFTYTLFIDIYTGTYTKLK